MKGVSEQRKQETPNDASSNIHNTRIDPTKWEVGDPLPNLVNGTKMADAHKLQGARNPELGAAETLEDSQKSSQVAFWPPNLKLEEHLTGSVTLRYDTKEVQEKSPVDKVYWGLLLDLYSVLPQGNRSC